MRRECRVAAAGRVLTPSILLLCRQTLEGNRDAGRASYQIALTVCKSCRRATQQGRGEAIEVRPQVVEMAECDAQHIGNVNAHVRADGEARGRAHVGVGANTKARASDGVDACAHVGADDDEFARAHVGAVDVSIARAHVGVASVRAAQASTTHPVGAAPRSTSTRRSRSAPCASHRTEALSSRSRHLNEISSRSNTRSPAGFDGLAGFTP